MSTKRRVAAAASPEVKTRGKRRKVSVSRRAMAPRFLAYTIQYIGDHPCYGFRSFGSGSSGTVLFTARPDIATCLLMPGVIHQDEELADRQSNRASSRSASEPADDVEAEGNSLSQDEREPKADFEGDSLQEAQDKIMSELTRLKDAE